MRLFYLFYLAVIYETGANQANLHTQFQVKEDDDVYELCNIAPLLAIAANLRCHFKPAFSGRRRQLHQDRRAGKRGSLNKFNMTNNYYSKWPTTDFV